MITGDYAKKTVLRRRIPTTQLVDAQGRFINLDAQGKVIDKHSKDKSATEIEGDSRFCGKRFAIAGHIEGEKKCLYCGVWFGWTSEKRDLYLRTMNIDPYNCDTNIEPLHCASDHCQEYHRLCREAAIKNAEIEEEKMKKRGLELFKRLKDRGIL